MPLVHRKFITREMVRAEKSVLFVFGDNFHRAGLGGQAKEMRGEPNAVGLVTKGTPGHNEADYLTNADLGRVIHEGRAAVGVLISHLLLGGTVVWPQDGIGTGLARLQEKAPLIAVWYSNLHHTLEGITARCKHGLNAERCIYCLDEKGLLL